MCGCEKDESEAEQQHRLLEDTAVNPNHCLHVHIIIQSKSESSSAEELPSALRRTECRTCSGMY